MGRCGWQRHELQNEYRNTVQDGWRDRLRDWPAGPRTQLDGWRQSAFQSGSSRTRRGEGWDSPRWAKPGCRAGAGFDPQFGPVSPRRAWLAMGPIAELRLRAGNASWGWDLSAGQFPGPGRGPAAFQSSVGSALHRTGS